MPKITPCLWFDGQAEEAATFYTGIFRKGSRIVSVARYGEAGPGPAGSAMTVVFELDGQRFIGLNGGPQFRFSEAISLSIDCGTQEEVDWFWEQLGEGGEHGPCGWLKDRYGLSWQVVPSILRELLSDAGPGRSQSVMRAMLRMRKLDIEELKRAYERA